MHCQHIVFCGSADNGYARVLGPHRESKRISMVEGPPFGRELKELAAGFETTSFPGVFRSRQLSKRGSFGGTITPPAITPPRTPTENYASVARAAPAVPEVSVNNSIPANLPMRATKASNPRLVVCRNANGERVDSPLHYSTKGKLEVLKQQKFCNQFHILGTCSYEERGCTHKHEPRLDEQDVINLMCVARLSACPRGLRCDDKSCVHGHRCPKDCTLPTCKFPHGVDTRIVSPA